MYQSKKSIQKKSLQALKKDFQIFLDNNTRDKIYSSGLKRPLFLSEFPDARIGYSKDGKKVEVHIKEKQRNKKDRKLFIISFYHN